MSAPTNHPLTTAATAAIKPEPNTDGFETALQASIVTIELAPRREYIPVLKEREGEQRRMFAIPVAPGLRRWGRERDDNKEEKVKVKEEEEEEEEVKEE
ncbi:hypothetical protein B7494_g6783 [Chlorociboria aeruginascens]|nr:hypothetical protein B7494_g6783 [Chlorociboria aeruginascens]